jgi:hypothetical protein
LPRASYAGELTADSRGNQEEAQAPPGLESAPVIVVCKRCREPVRVDPDVRVSFCRLHGLVEFVFVSLTQRGFGGRS